MQEKPNSNNKAGYKNSLGKATIINKHKMKKIVYLLMAVSLSVNVVKAQSVEQGIKFLNYERKKSAIETLKKAYDANSKDPVTIYWYGQAMLASEDIVGAKALYQKGIQELPDDAWMIVGLAHVSLLEGGDINKAKQNFEYAITKTTTKKKENVDILAAIGRANADGSTKIGDTAYGIEKLNRAIELKTTNLDVYISKGILFQKMGGEKGGEVVAAYEEATKKDPTFAKAFYRIGKIYQSQNNVPLFEENYNKAIAADPNFPMAYLELFQYYAQKDVNKAKEYLDKYLAVADKSCDNDYFNADYLFRAGKYQESLDKAKQLEAGDCKGFYKLPLLLAFNYDRLKDSVQAKTSLEKYFAATAVDKIEPAHYELAVKVFSKFAGSEVTTAAYLQKAIDTDTSKANKLVYLKQGADMFGKAKMYSEQVKWLTKLNDLRGTMAEFDYYSISAAAFAAKDYVGTQTFAKSYIMAFPDKSQGYDFLVRSAKKIDTINSTGIVVEALTKQNEFLVKDSIKNKDALIRNYFSMMGYYNDKVKDYAKALEYCDKILALSPGDAEMTVLRTAIEKNLNSKSKTATPPAKPATGTNKTQTPTKPPTSTSGGAKINKPKAPKK